MKINSHNEMAHIGQFSELILTKSIGMFVFFANRSKAEVHSLTYH